MNFAERILWNKTGMSARSSSAKMKMWDQERRQENTAELGNDAELDSKNKTKLDERT